MDLDAQVIAAITILRKRKGKTKTKSPPKVLWTQNHRLGNTFTEKKRLYFVGRKTRRKKVNQER